MYFVQSCTETSVAVIVDCSMYCLGRQCHEAAVTANQKKSRNNRNTPLILTRSVSRPSVACFPHFIRCIYMFFMPAPLPRPPRQTRQTGLTIYDDGLKQSRFVRAQKNTADDDTTTAPFRQQEETRNIATSNNHHLNRTGQKEDTGVAIVRSACPTTNVSAIHTRLTPQ